jgi:hypothetical protein
MKSYEVQDHGVSDQFAGQAKKPWVTPSLQILALESAEAGHGNTFLDFPGSQSHIRHS